VTRAGTLAFRERSQEVITLPRSGVIESWMDAHVGAYEARRAIGRAYVDVTRARDPIPNLIDADQRLIRLTEFARRKAGEASGISYIAPGQSALWDGCLEGDDSERGA